MVAFAIIVVWEKFSEAEMMIAQEAGAVATIFRLSKGAGAELAPALQSEMTKYTDTVIEQDWPTMAKAEGGSARASSQALNELYATTLAFNPDSSRETSIQREILSQMDVITASRRVRTVLSAGIMPVLSGGFCSGGGLHYNRIHVLLRNSKRARLDVDDRHAERFDLFGLADHHCD